MVESIDRTDGAGPVQPRHASVPEMVEHTVERYARQTAFTTVMPNGLHGDLTFTVVNQLADAFAAYLREVIGVAAGTRVAVQVPNSLAVPIVVFGTLKAGCVLVNTNPLYTPHEMRHQFVDSRAEVLVISDLFADKLDEVIAHVPIGHVVVCSLPAFFPPLVRHLVQGVLKYGKKLVRPTRVPHVRLEAAIAAGRAHLASRSADASAYWRDLNHDDLACLQYTGGTTGTSKGAMLTHGNLLWNVAQIAALGRSKVEAGAECVITALPLYHAFAFTVNLLFFFQAGARNVLIPSPRPIANLRKAFERYPVSWTTGVNTLFKALLDAPWFAARPPQRMKVAIGGGASIHPDVVERWGALTGSPLVEGYGLTEATAVVTFQPLQGELRADSIGLPAPGTEVRLIADDGREVADGQPGELMVRGPQVMQRYWNQPAETAKVLGSGWLATGDVATRGAGGYLRIVDRKKDVILVSGFNVYPNEVEAVLSGHPQVADAAVIGTADAKSGEAVRAYVVKRDDALDAETLIAHCRGVLTAYKVPTRVEFVAELPKTPIGKILRKELRDRVLHGAQAGAPGP